MKITFETPKPHEEDEIIIRCHVVDDDLMHLIYNFKDHKEGITAYQQREIVKLSPKDIFYFESVDNSVFIYTQKQVFKSTAKLYILEEQLAETPFARISKNTILNLRKLQSVRPVKNARLEGTLLNGEKTVISRQYVQGIKRNLGV